MKRLNLGQRVKQRRLELGWTQAQLAEKSGYSRIYILKVETSQIKNPGVKTLDKISRSLGIEMESLWK